MTSAAVINELDIKLQEMLSDASEVVWKKSEWIFDPHGLKASPANGRPVRPVSTRSTACHKQRAGNASNARGTCKDGSCPHRASAYDTTPQPGDITLLLHDSLPSDQQTELWGKCHVPGCGASLSNLREFHQRFQICDEHIKAPRVVRDGQVERFCQQCSRFHSVTEFDGDRRSCRTQLERHNARRRKQRAVAAAAASASAQPADTCAAHQNPPTPGACLARSSCQPPLQRQRTCCEKATRPTHVHTCMGGQAPNNLLHISEPQQQIEIPLDSHVSSVGTTCPIHRVPVGHNWNTPGSFIGSQGCPGNPSEQYSSGIQTNSEWFPEGNGHVVVSASCTTGDNPSTHMHPVHGKGEWTQPSDDLTRNIPDLMQVDSSVQGEHMCFMSPMAIRDGAELLEPYNFLQNSDDSMVFPSTVAEPSSKPHKDTAMMEPFNGALVHGDSFAQNNAANAAHWRAVHAHRTVLAPSDVGSTFVAASRAPQSVSKGSSGPDPGLIEMPNFFDWTSNQGMVSDDMPLVEHNAGGQKPPVVTVADEEILQCFFSKPRLVRSLKRLIMGYPSTNARCCGPDSFQGVCQNVVNARIEAAVSSAHLLLTKSEPPADANASLCICAKLWNCTPDTLPANLHHAVLSWVNAEDPQMCGCIRPGCVFLTMDVTLSYKEKRSALARGALSLMQHLLKWCSCWREQSVLIQIEDSLAFSKPGEQPRSLNPTSSNKWAARPVVSDVSCRVFLTDGETPIRVFVSGRNLPTGIGAYKGKFREGSNEDPSGWGKVNPPPAGGEDTRDAGEKLASEQARSYVGDQPSKQFGKPVNSPMLIARCGGEDNLIISVSQTTKPGVVEIMLQPPQLAPSSGAVLWVEAWSGTFLSPAIPVFVTCDVEMACAVEKLIDKFQSPANEHKVPNVCKACMESFLLSLC